MNDTEMREMEQVRKKLSKIQKHVFKEEIGSHKTEIKTLGKRRVVVLANTFKDLCIIIGYIY